MPGRSSMERKTAPAHAEARRSGELDRYVAQELNQEGSKTKISPALLVVRVLQVAKQAILRRSISKTTNHLMKRRQS